MKDDSVYCTLMKRTLPYLIMKKERWRVEDAGRKKTEWGKRQPQSPGH